MSDAERDEVVADLADLAVYQALLEGRGRARHRRRLRGLRRAALPRVEPAAGEPAAAAGGGPHAPARARVRPRPRRRTSAGSTAAATPTRCSPTAELRGARAPTRRRPPPRREGAVAVVRRCSSWVLRRGVGRRRRDAGPGRAGGRGRVRRRAGPLARAGAVVRTGRRRLLDRPGIDRRVHRALACRPGCPNLAARGAAPASAPRERSSRPRPAGSAWAGPGPCPARRAQPAPLPWSTGPDRTSGSVDCGSVTLCDADGAVTAGSSGADARHGGGAAAYRSGGPPGCSSAASTGRPACSGACRRAWPPGTPAPATSCGCPSSPRTAGISVRIASSSLCGGRRVARLPGGAHLLQPALDLDLGLDRLGALGVDHLLDRPQRVAGHRRSASRDPPRSRWPR